MTKEKATVYLLRALEQLLEENPDGEFCGMDLWDHMEVCDEDLKQVCLAFDGKCGEGSTDPLECAAVFADVADRMLDELDSKPELWDLLFEQEGLSH